MRIRNRNSDASAEGAKKKEDPTKKHRSGNWRGSLRIYVALLPQLSLRPQLFPFPPSLPVSFLPAAARPLYGRVTSNLRVAHFSPRRRRRDEARPRGAEGKGAKGERGKGPHDDEADRAKRAELRERGRALTTLPRTSAKNLEGRSRSAVGERKFPSFKCIYFAFYLPRYSRVFFYLQERYSRVRTGAVKSHATQKNCMSMLYFRPHQTFPGAFSYSKNRQELRLSSE